MPEWIPIFDPIKFQEEHKSPHLKEWMLAEPEMLTWAEKVVDLRKQIVKKAVESERDLSPRETSVYNLRSRKGLKYSTKSSNPLGLMEKEMKAR